MLCPICHKLVVNGLCEGCLGDLADNMSDENLLDALGPQTLSEMRRMREFVEMELSQ